MGTSERFHPGHLYQSREVLPVGTKEAPSQSERRVVMGQGAPSSVFAKGRPLSQSPVGTSTSSPSTVLCIRSAHFTDEGTDLDVVTEVPKGTCKPHKPLSLNRVGQIPLLPDHSLGLPPLISEVGALGTTASVDPCSLSVQSRPTPVQCSSPKGRLCFCRSPEDGGLHLNVLSLSGRVREGASGSDATLGWI